MKKSVFVILAFLILVIASCNLPFGGITTTTSTSTTTTIASQHWRTTSYSYTYMHDGVLSRHYSDTYHYPSANTGRYDSRDRVYTYPSASHQLLKYTRDNLGRISKLEYFNAAVTPNTLSSYNIRTYNTSSENYSQIIYYNSSGNVTSYAVYNYNSDNLLVAEIYCQSSSYEPNYRYDYEYDDAGLLIKQVCTDYNYGATPTVETSYITTLKNADGKTLNTKYYSDPGKTDLTDEDAYTYDANGNMTSLVYSYYDSGDVYTYDYTYEEYYLM